MIPAIRELDRPKITKWLEGTNKPDLLLIAAQRPLAVSGYSLPDWMPSPMETIRLIRRREFGSDPHRWRWVAQREDSYEIVCRSSVWWPAHA